MALHRSFAFHRLDGLHVAGPGVAHAEIDARLAQSEIAGIEIDRDQVPLFGRSQALSKHGMGGDPRGIGRTELELELNLLRIALRLVSGHRDFSNCSVAALKRREDSDATSSAARSEEHTSELQSRGHLVC